ncbi:hypothetical protein SISSUDRAFT_1067478 [Sistotremastrum suecicum HHB10207 ss-3]|uniref:Uncharacterized protein n=1 Tax=Sistotremastrum suecicum HHB10207 ss-3 TaxID=1314776 RepID=A0A165X2N1_9AGAM|nr:hypothetical protein SISSUDRAFT_1067478 [Sistotremastrum suecicum HHB10207 ss-3]
MFSSIGFQLRGSIVIVSFLLLASLACASFVVPPAATVISERDLSAGALRDRDAKARDD